MGDGGNGKIILIHRKTRLQELVARYNTVLQARFYMEHMGADFSDYIDEDSRYREALTQARLALEPLGRVQAVDREYVPNFLFGPRDIVVAVGQDGLVANTIKYLDAQPLIGVNPDPERWDGLLLPFQAQELRAVVPDVLKGRRPLRQITLARATLNDGQTLHAVNDLFIGQRTHVSARYELRMGERAERQSSSGVIVSTGLGATGWLKSVLAGAAGIVRALGSTEAILPEARSSWDTDHLFYSVREPFPSRTSGAQMVFGTVTRAQPLTVLSQMAEGGVIFSDGVEQDFLVFNAGMRATVTVADKMGRLVV